MFTRFGARLEAGMEAALKRGRILREVLKQDRLAPISARFQMAWLVAFNDGLFDDIDPFEVPDRLSALEVQVHESTLGLNEERKLWASAVKEWLRP